jgi:hypothetical protein
VPSRKKALLFLKTKQEKAGGGKPLHPALFDNLVWAVPKK